MEERKGRGWLFLSGAEVLESVHDDLNGEERRPVAGKSSVSCKFWVQRGGEYLLYPRKSVAVDPSDMPVDAIIQVLHVHLYAPVDLENSELDVSTVERVSSRTRGKEKPKTYAFSAYVALFTKCSVETSRPCGRYSAVEM